MFVTGSKNYFYVSSNLWLIYVLTDRRKNIDSRTFTRPKKRMGRPSLELLESLSCLSKPVVSPNIWASGSNEMAIDNMTCSLLENSLMNCSVDTSQISDINSQLSIVNKKQKVTSQTERRRVSVLFVFCWICMYFTMKYWTNLCCFVNTGKLSSVRSKWWHPWRFGFNPQNW